MNRNDVPSVTLLYNPTLRAIREHGGSASISEIEDHVVLSLGLEDDILAITNTTSRQSTLYNRLGWARTHLKNCGYLDNKSWGVWALTAAGQNTQSVDPEEIQRRAVQSRQVGKTTVATARTPEDDDAVGISLDGDFTWRDQLLETLLAMDPTEFERLCQRILRESGFTDVSVTKRSADGGIDGNAILQLQGFISFPVAFQSKRYSGSVGSSIVREFRGSLGRQADRGLLMTTGTFTPDARREATREGAVFIDLIDGDGLLNRLKDLRLGVKVEMVEQTTVDSEWWQSTYGVSPTETD